MVRRGGDIGGQAPEAAPTQPPLGKASGEGSPLGPRGQPCASRRAHKSRRRPARPLLSAATGTTFSTMLRYSLNWRSSDQWPCSRADTCSITSTVSRTLLWKPIMTCSAHAHVHVQCTHSAHTAHMQRTCSAHAHAHAHAVHMSAVHTHLHEEPVLVPMSQGLLDLEQELVCPIRLAGGGGGGGGGEARRLSRAARLPGERLRLGPAGWLPEALHGRRGHQLGRWPALPLAPPVVGVHLHRARRHRALAARGHAHRRRRGRVREATERGADLTAELHALDDVDRDARVESLSVLVVAPSHGIQADRGGLRLAPMVESSGLGASRQGSERRRGLSMAPTRRGLSLRPKMAALCLCGGWPHGLPRARPFQPSCCTAQRWWTNAQAVGAGARL